MDDPAEIFTSLRADRLCMAREKSPFYLPEFHRQRLVSAAKELQWVDAWANHYLQDSTSWTAFLESQLDSVKVKLEEGAAFKVRVSLNKAGDLTTLVSPIPSTKLGNLYPAELLVNPTPADFSIVYNIIIDSKPTSFDRLTWLKTSSRNVYDASRRRMSERLAELNIDELKDTNNEVLLGKESGEIIEGSFTNAYFWREGTWLTPSVGQAHGGGLEGTARRWALSTGLCKEGVIDVASVREYERVWVSNGVRGFLQGVVICLGC